MKPAEQTPLTCLRMARLAQKAGIPDGVINVVPGYGPTAGAAIVKHPGVDKIAFTGEYRTAQIIMRDAAQTLEAADVRAGRQEPEHRLCRRRSRRGRGRLALRACISTRASAAVPAAGCSCRKRSTTSSSTSSSAMNKSRKLGDPFDPDTEQGPQVDKAQFDKIMHYIDLGKKEGRQVPDRRQAASATAATSSSRRCSPT